MQNNEINNHKYVDDIQIPSSLVKCLLDYRYLQVYWTKGWMDALSWDNRKYDQW